MMRILGSILFLALWAIITITLTISLVGLIPLTMMAEADWFDIPMKCLNFLTK